MTATFKREVLCKQSKKLATIEGT